MPLTESAPGFVPHPLAPPLHIVERGTGGEAADSGATRVRFFFLKETAHLPPLDNSKAPRTRVNRQIRISPVRVIADNGDQLGVLTIDEAIGAANERGLDLAEVATLAWPSVDKVIDYGTFKFVQAKAARAATKKEHDTHFKEVKY